jgi:hypothetical protein
MWGPSYGWQLRQLVKHHVSPGRKSNFWISTKNLRHKRTKYLNPIYPIEPRFTLKVQCELRCPRKRWDLWGFNTESVGSFRPSTAVSSTRLLEIIPITQKHSKNGATHGNSCHSKTSKNRRCPRSIWGFSWVMLPVEDSAIDSAAERWSSSRALLI